MRLYPTYKTDEFACYIFMSADTRHKTLPAEAKDFNTSEKVPKFHVRIRVLWFPSPEGMFQRVPWA